MKNFGRRPIETVKGDHQMIHVKIRFVFSMLLTVAVFLAAGLLAITPSARAQAPEQRTFSSADEAWRSLVSAAKAKARTALASLFGPSYDQLLSGDDVEDAKDLDDFAVAVGESAQFQKIEDSKYTVTVGRDNWPTPIPLVQKAG